MSRGRERPPCAGGTSVPGGVSPGGASVVVRVPGADVSGTSDTITPPSPALLASPLDATRVWSSAMLTGRSATESIGVAAIALPASEIRAAAPLATRSAADHSTMPSPVRTPGRVRRSSTVLAKASAVFHSSSRQFV